MVEEERRKNSSVKNELSQMRRLSQPVKQLAEYVLGIPPPFCVAQILAPLFQRINILRVIHRRIVETAF